MGVKAFTLPRVKGLSLAYAAPERMIQVISGKDEILPDRIKSSDVYSVAIVLHEILNRERAWAKVNDSEALKLAVMVGKRPDLSDRVQKCIDEGSGEGKAYRALFDLIEASWAQDPKNRDTMAQVVQKLSDIAPQITNANR
jgi:hypothetical protein